MADVRILAGWRNDPESSLASVWSPQMQARMASAEVADSREAEHDERQRRVRAEVWHERQVEAAVRSYAAENAVDLRTAAREVGRTPFEAVQYYSALADRHDALAEAQRQAEIRKLLAAHGYTDDSANKPTEFAAELALEVASRNSALGEGEEFLSKRELADAGQGLRTRWLRRQTRGTL